MKVQAFAKINWDLHIVGKRADGFHELDSLMVNIGLADELEFSEAPSLGMTCSNPALPVGEDNLVIRAARAMAASANRTPNFKIHLAKRIPHGGGLGGGSSDAAAVLITLNNLWGLGWSKERLVSIGSVLGSDVPFFLYGGWCRCRGRGEIVEPLATAPALGAARLLLLLPDLVVPTPSVYRALKAQPWDGKPAFRSLTQLRDEFTFSFSRLAVQGTPPDAKSSSGNALSENGLRAAAVSVEPRLAPLQALLAVRFPGRWQMSGSGATHFVVLAPSDAIDPRGLEDELRGKLPYDISVVDTTTVTPRFAPSES